MFSCHNLILFLYFPCNKILLNYFFAHIMFLFLFHDMDLELSLLLFSSWFKNHVNLVVFMPMTIWTKSHQTYFCHFFLLSFCFKIMSTFMEEVLAILRKFEHENQALCRMCCSFANQSSFNLFGMCFHNTTLTKGTTN